MKITELSQEKYFNIRNFFNADYPNLAFIFAVIEKSIPGRVFVDTEDNPSVCLIICSGTPYCFIGGELNREIFTYFLPLLKEKGLVKLVCPPNNDQINLIDFGFIASPNRM